MLNLAAIQNEINSTYVSVPDINNASSTPSYAEYKEYWKGLGSATLAALVEGLEDMIVPLLRICMVVTRVRGVRVRSARILIISQIQLCHCITPSHHCTLDNYKYRLYRISLNVTKTELALRARTGYILWHQQHGRHRLSAPRQCSVRCILLIKSLG